MSKPTEVERRKRIEELLKEHEDAPRDQRETLRVTWQGDAKLLQVIRIPLEFVMLNPRSHRIQSQLESDPAAQAIVSQDPFTDEAQEVIGKFLRMPEDDFAEFKANVEEEGQREPGIITRVGLLVNANRRACALTDINPHGYIRVAVLPANATNKEISTLELQLQIQKDFRLDYTFTNLLLFVEDMKVNHGFSDEDVARALNYAASSDKKALRDGAKQVQQHTRILAMLRMLQARSGGKVPLTFFDDKRQLLIDLDSSYEAAKGSNPEEAEKMREARFLAILVGADYRPTRSLGGETIENHFVPAIEDIDDIGADLVAMTQDPEPRDASLPTGVEDLLDVGGEQPAGADSLRPLVDLIASSFGAESVSVDSDGTAKPVEREGLLARLRTSVETAHDEARNADKKVRTLDAPVEYLHDAKLKTERALQAYKEVAAHGEFRLTKFKYELKRLAQAVRRLQDEVEGPEEN